MQANVSSNLRKRVADRERGFESRRGHHKCWEVGRSQLRVRPLSREPVTTLAVLLEHREGIRSLNDHRVRSELRARLPDVRGLLRRDVPRARPILRRLLVGPLARTPFAMERGH